MPTPMFWTVSGVTEWVCWSCSAPAWLFNSQPFQAGALGSSQHLSACALCHFSPGFLNHRQDSGPWAMLHPVLLWINLKRWPLFSPETCVGRQRKPLASYVVHLYIVMGKITSTEGATQPGQKIWFVTWFQTWSFCLGLRVVCLSSMPCPVQFHLCSVYPQMLLWTQNPTQCSSPRSRWSRKWIGWPQKCSWSPAKEMSGKITWPSLVKIPCCRRSGRALFPAPGCPHGLAYTPK